jgi:hypothetical protein
MISKCRLRLCSATDSTERLESLEHQQKALQQANASDNTAARRIPALPQARQAPQPHFAFSAFSALAFCIFSTCSSKNAALQCLT